jgi:3',5'-cyclic AMP phosphodiesterase CpdA
MGCSLLSKEDTKPISEKDKIIYIASDLHYLSDKLTDHGVAYAEFSNSRDGKQLDYMDEILDAFSNDIKKSKPDLLIISGDLTCNGEKVSHQDLAEKLKLIEQKGTSIYVIPGNHDILNPWARGFKDDSQYKVDSIDEKEFSTIYSDFGFTEAISNDKDTLSYLAAPSNNLWLLMLDTNKYKNNFDLGSPQTDGILAKSTLDWIQECCDLAKEKGATIITVMHHNILNHSERIQEGFTLNNSDQTRVIFKRNNLNLVFSGHIHIQDISSDKKEIDPLYDIASNALSVFPHQYGVLKYNNLDLSLDYSTARVDVERWAKNVKSKDRNLKNFSKYSEEYFGMKSYDRTYNSLLADTDYTKEEIVLIAETIKTLNTRYFAGIEHLNSKDIINSEGYKLLLNLKDNFLTSYAESISNDNDIDDNQLFIKIN